MMNSAQGAQILVVEDDPISQKVVRFIFNTLKCVVDVAGTGKEALDTLEQKKYDLIIVDIGLPDFDGVSLAKEIINKDATARIVALTAHNDGDYRQASLQVGMLDYFTKPVTVNLAQKIVSMIEVSSNSGSKINDTL